MRCIVCKSEDTGVIDSRVIGNQVKRRRECKNCGKRFTTIEIAILPSITVIKSDESKRIFDREKLKKGISRAFNKIEYTDEQIDELVDDIENEIRDNYGTTVKSSDIGKIVLEKLKNINEVSYIRFASVYNKFLDISSFIETINDLKSDKVNK
ncbi:transcriptional regulator NrdR [Oceanivirga miroungae]|uniref:Transcriptional repressor NrdR n=1 Tax=Oceanivirga miroungae TaxID=1130046 RepID=A0A6I8MAQ1_9FUSO|nr:transcriptional regulator NrdR [Oceanivirga miroungae]VWL85253.1 ATP-cone domain-containing protein [Oceanivirga miroungae]